MSSLSRKIVLASFFKFLPLLLLLACSVGTRPSGEEKDLKLEGNKSELSTPYSIFMEGYKNLNPELIGNAYSEDAMLINVYNGSEPKSYKGRASIRSFFAENFKKVKNDSAQFGITFKISSREVLQESVLDNGYYKLEIVDQKGRASERYGKFSIMLKKEEGAWKFFMDTNATSSQEEFYNANQFNQWTITH